VKGTDQFVDRPFARYETVNPVQIGKTHPKPSLRLRVIDPERDNDLARFTGHSDLAPNIFAFVAAFRKDQEHRPAGIYSFGNLVVEWFAGPYIARRDPAAHTAPLKLGDDGFGVRSIFADVADEQKYIGRRHAPAPQGQTDLK
jgi:hypothetical protein